MGGWKEVRVYGITVGSYPDEYFVGSNSFDPYLPTELTCGRK
jgi:hypothetical protein